MTKVPSPTSEAKNSQIMPFLMVALVMSFLYSNVVVRRDIAVNAPSPGPATTTRDLALTTTARGGIVNTEKPSCNTLLKHLPKPIMFTQTKANEPFQLAVENPATDPMISAMVVDTGLWDVHVLKALEEVGGDACKQGEMAMDVGANLGFFTIALLAMGCRVNSFEMQPEMAQRVKFSACSNDNLDRLTMNLGAVSDERATLHMVDSRSGNRITITVQDDATVPVQARRIDEIMDLNTRIVVMKIDVEGHEKKALKGMEKMFQKRLVQNIVMEFSPNDMGLEDSTEVLNYLYSYGFTNIIELDYMKPSEYKEPAKTRPVDTSGEYWARRFSQKIMEGGDTRGLKFTDLWLKLE